MSGNNSSSMPMMDRIRRIFMVGIGGSGMSGIAEVLARLGYEVAGSDLQESPVLDRLRDLGVEVHIGHDSAYVQEVDVLVTSGAIQANNPELVAAKAARIPVVPRAEMLAELMRHRYGIAVAGTHGKTTTTSLLASIFAEAGEDPTFVVGGVLNRVGSNAGLGEGRYLIVEADESDASFLHLLPMVSVVTNIEADHMEHYGSDYKNYENAFVGFLHNLPFYGFAVMCLDDPGVRAVIPHMSRRFISYGQHKEADYHIKDILPRGLESQFTVCRPGGLADLTLTLAMPGHHNVLNASAAVAVASELGLADDSISVGVANFEGVGRRFTIMGEIQSAGGTALLVDDYGHHPTEVAATLDAAEAAFPDRRLVMVYQPHRYTRTRDHYDDFVAVLSRCEVLVLLDVYPAGEALIPGADSRSLARSIRQRGLVDPVVVSGVNEVPPVLSHLLQEGDLLLTQGAGNIARLAQSLSKSKSVERLV